jgi:hypothetical protein
MTSYRRPGAGRPGATIPAWSEGRCAPAWVEFLELNEEPRHEAQRPGGMVRRLVRRLVPVRRREVRDLVRRCNVTDCGTPLRRIGSPGDGGYVIPDDLEGLCGVFSPGVCDTADFELHFARTGTPCYLADRSVPAPPIDHPMFRFRRQHVGPVSADGVVSLHDWVREEHPSSGDLLLQMDIEGAEYDTLLACPREILRRFRVLVIELHFLHRLGRRRWHRNIAGALERLLQDFTVVHAHPNNCTPPRRVAGMAISPVMELSFLRNDRIRVRRPVKSLPSELDRPNVAGARDYPLDPAWYRGAAP